MVGVKGMAVIMNRMKIHLKRMTRTKKTKLSKTNKMKKIMQLGEARP